MKKPNDNPADPFKKALAEATKVLADDAEDLLGRGLALQPCLQFAKLPDVLDGDHCLSGEGFDNCDLFLGEGSNLAAIEIEAARRLCEASSPRFQTPRSSKPRYAPRRSRRDKKAATGSPRPRHGSPCDTADRRTAHPEVPRQRQTLQHCGTPPRHSSARVRRSLLRLRSIRS